MNYGAMPEKASPRLIIRYDYYFVPKILSPASPSPGTI